MEAVFAIREMLEESHIEVNVVRVAQTISTGTAKPKSLRSRISRRVVEMLERHGLPARPDPWLILIEVEES